MKKIKLLMLSTTLLMGSFLTLKNESRMSTSGIEVNQVQSTKSIKKAISYNEKFSYVLFDGETCTETPSWCEVKNINDGGTIITDEVSGISFKITARSATSFVYNHTSSTKFPYEHSIKVGGEFEEGRRIEFTIPEGLTAVLKMEICANNAERELVLRKYGDANNYFDTNVIDSTIVNDFISSNLDSEPELSAGTYCFESNGTIFIGKLVLEITGLSEIHYLDEDSTLIADKMIKTGNTISNPLKGADKLGQKFKYWSATPNGTEFDFANTAINEETTLYAVYEDCDTFTITFNYNNADIDAKQVIVNEGDTVEEPEEPKRSGFKFDSWYYNNKPYNFNTLVTEDMTLFAKWVLDSVPVINGPDSLRFGYSKPVDISAILLQYSAVDEEDESVKIKLEKDTYTLSAQELGSYEITISATDSSGNKTSKTIPVEVYDDLAPVFEGPTTIYKSTSIALTTNDLLKEIKAKDGIDGDVDIEVVSDSYTGYANKVGNYALELLAKDSNSNRRTFTLNVNVSDDIANVWYVPEKTINVQKNIQLKSDDIINLLLHTGELKSGYSSIDTTSNYSFDTENQNDVGIYSISLKARYYSGEEIILTRAINVYDSEEATQKRDNTFTKTWKHCYNIIVKNVGNFFISIYNGIVTLFGQEQAKASYLKGFEIFE